MRKLYGAGRPRSSLFVFLAGLSLGCSDAHFSGQAPAKKAEPPKPVEETFALTCAGGALTQDVELKPNTVVQATLKGELCPVATGAATVLFVVDYSGSMGKHVPQQGGDAVPGNDPQGAGDCGRLQAAKAVLNQLAAQGQADVQVGFVPFAGDVLEERVIGLTKLAAFQASVTKETFCSYVVQSPSFGLDPANAGGIQSPNANSSTNYAAALRRAEGLLQGQTGKKVVYFVSDGEPTSGGADPAAAGVSAGEALRQNVADLTLNALLLGPDAAEAQGVMNQVAGSEARVRVAAKASELASEIVQFESLDLTDATATLQRGDGPSAALGLASFARTEGASLWTFLTEAFALEAAPGETVAHRITVAAKTLDGAAVQASATLNVRGM